MEEEEEEDKLLLTSLGVTLAAPEDIEQVIWRKAECKAEDGLHTGENSENGSCPEEQGKNPASTTHSKLFSKLQAVTFEIEAISASISDIKNSEKIENNTSAGIEHARNYHSVQFTPDGLTVQQALASDRLRSLEKTRDQIQCEIAKIDPKETVGESQFLHRLVQEEPKGKRKFKEAQHSGRNTKKEKVSYEDDLNFDAMLSASAHGLMESEKDALVRRGILTPFHSLKGFERRLEQPEISNSTNFLDKETENFISASIAKVSQSMSEIAQSRSTTKLVDANSLPKLDGPTRQFHRLKTPLKHPAAQENYSKQKTKRLKKLKRPLPGKKWRRNVENEILLKCRFDEDKERSSDVLYDEREEYEEDSDDNGSMSCIVLEGGLKIPEAIFGKLFDYQKVGVQWLWELHCQKAGGIIGDEMGLGKTVQVLSFLGALHHSKMYKPSIVICPVTLLMQWQREANKWYPKFHVEILHDSAHSSARLAKSKTSDSDCESEENSLDNERVYPAKSRNNKWDKLVSTILKSESGLLLTTYEQLRILGEKLLDIEWGYAVLDEGHRIRNPNADITLLCKQLQTVHRIIMTGAPIQNKLAELWSLFDFIFPGKLGVLPVFEMEFAVPISVGGYANATPLQVSTAYRCAIVLRDLIMPYLLRRMKENVNAQLTKKTEHVLFCSLTQDQRALYRAFLASSEVEQIFDGNRNSLYGIDILRKISNHPDLLEREQAANHPDYGNPDRSGKVIVLAKVLKLWKEQGHRVLVFTQTQQMLDIIESFLSSSGYIYRRMDGLTPVKQRMSLIDEFNNSSEIFVFIMTTKVGGLGTNLTGANRVVIYDPDWNPSTDIQARERAWRIGQTRDVTIYRLITRGTIEEKIYHRQIYKHFLTNKILKNPQQKRFFKARDMRDLFTLQDDEDHSSTETSNIFNQLSNDVNIASIDSSSNDSQVDNPSEGTCKTKLNTSETSGAEDEETNILKSLFVANGIHSAVNHDAIMNANDNNRVKFEEQASLVAQKAAEALRQSRMIRSQDSFSTPTWTGKCGAAGGPSSVRRKFGSRVKSNIFGSSKQSSDQSSQPPGFQVGTAKDNSTLSSAQLLARIKGNREKAVCDGFDQQLGSSSSCSRSEPLNKNIIVQPEILIRQLCTFIQQRGGSAGSGSIVQHFKPRIPTKDLPLFRNLLKEIAVLEKSAENGGSSMWILKPEYQN